MAKFIFAHYMNSLPIAITDKPYPEGYWETHYNNPMGTEGVKDQPGYTDHTPVAGWGRDAPWPIQPGEYGEGVSVVRPVGPATGLYSDFQYKDASVEIDRAVQYGIQGFGHDILEPSGPGFDRTKKHIRLASLRNDFKIVLIPDMTTGTGNQTATQMAAMVNDLQTAGDNGIYRHKGKLLLAPFCGLNSYKTPAYWQEVFDTLFALNGTVGSLMPMCTSLSSTIYDIFDTYSFVAGYALWGSRNPGSTANLSTIPGAMKARPNNANKSYMHPISAWDSRPTFVTYDENRGFDQLRLAWQQAIDTVTGSDDICQMLTWNDYYECSVFSPTVERNGDYGILEINKHFADWWLTGTEPALTSDRYFLTHRNQFAAKTFLLSSALTSGQVITSIPVSTLTAADATQLTVGTKLAFKGRHTIAHPTVTVQPSAGATSISITSYTLPSSYAIGAAVTKMAYPHTPLDGKAYNPMVNRKYLPSSEGGTTTATATVDEVEIYTILQEAKVITPTIGGIVQTPYTANAGHFIKKLQLVAGPPPSIEARHDAVLVATLTSNKSVTTTPLFQNMSYTTASLVITEEDMVESLITSMTSFVNAVGVDVKTIYDQLETKAEIDPDGNATLPDVDYLADINAILNA